MKKIILFIIFIFAAGFFITNAKTAAAAENKTATLETGGSYTFFNGDADNYYYVVSKNPISQTNLRYEYVSRDKNGAVESYGSLGGSFLISGGGSFTLTVTGPSALIVEFAGHITFEKTDGAALFSYAAEESGSVLISNKNNFVPYSVSVSSPGARRPPKYDYVSKDISGNVTGFYGACEESSLDAPAGGSCLVTPADGAVIFTMPNEWAEDLAFTPQTGGALADHTVAAGKTVFINNSSGDLNFYAETNSGPLPLQPKYAYVSRDAHASVTAFETDATGDIFIPADGSVTVTAGSGAPLKIWLPAEWTRAGVSFAESDEPALFYFSAAPGKTVSIKNKNDSNSFALRADNDGGTLSPKLDYIYKDSAGLITDYGRGLEGPVFVPDGGETILTVTNGYTLNIYAPYGWGGELVLSELSARALANVTLNPGDSALINNFNGDSAFDIKTDASPETQAPKFDYVFTDDAGYILNYGSADLFGGFRVTGGGSAVITAGRNRVLNVYFPAEWRGKHIEIKTSGVAPAVAEYRLGAGKSALIKNTRESSAVIATNSGQPLAPKFDYALRDSAGKVTSFVPPDYYGEITITSLGEASVTAGKDYDLKFLLPGEWLREEYITITEAENPSVFYKTLASGQSVTIENSDPDFFADIRVFESETGAHDFVQKNFDGEIISFGVAASPEIISVWPGGRYQLTVNRGHELCLYMPYEWAENFIEFKNAYASVSSFTIKAGESAEIQNADKIYAYALGTNSSDGVFAPSFDYVYYDPENKITGYGSGDIDKTLTVPESSRVILTAKKGGDLKIWFPFEWQNDRLISFAKRHEPSLFHLTVPSGKTVEITNKANEAYNIKNNSGGGPTEPKYDCKLWLPGRGETETKSQHGEIAVPPEARLIIKAADGYDMKLWMPGDWLKSLVLK